jgi:hypothetical protein
MGIQVSVAVTVLCALAVERGVGLELKDVPARTKEAVTATQVRLPILGRWRFTKYGPVTGTFDFRSDGTYAYAVQDGTVRLSHEGTYQWRAPRTAVSLRGLLGIIELTPVKRIADPPPTSLIIRSTLMDNDEPRSYFVQDNLSPQYTQGIPTLSLCDTTRDWPGCAQTTRLYEDLAPW